MKEFVKKNKENLIIIGISILAFIIGYFSIGWMISLLVIGVADLILFIPNIIKKLKKGKTKNNIKKIEKKKDTREKKKKGKAGKIIKIIFKVLIIIFFLIVIAGIVAAGLFWKSIVDNAPKFDPELLYHKESSLIYDMNGNEIKKLAYEKRENIAYEELPEVLINAIIATEDSRFFQHNGFDLPRFAVASFKAVLGQDGGGASTLTMQVSKNTYTSKAVSIKRKFTDIYMAMFEIEKNHTKQEIIEFYVNYPYLGGGAYGVEQACQNYFGKSAKDINLAEAALIAGLFQSPGGYDPYLYPEKAETRRQTVLKLMERHGYITEAQRKEATKMSVDKLLSTTDNNTSNYVYQSFIDEVLKEIKKDTGLDPYTTPMEIYTTMDPNQQSYVYSIMKGESFTWENDVVDAGIAIVNVKTGAITALGGGRNKDQEKTFNNATDLKNQIGSTSKPIFDYAVGIEYENWSTYTPFVDEPYKYSDGTTINNWDGQFKGWMTARDALAQSRNIPALKAFQLNKNSNIKTFVTNLGLHPEVDIYGNLHEAHSIGGYTGESPLNMAAAYAAFANQGMYTKPYSYTKIVLRESGEVIEKNISKTKAMSEETAYMMTSMLQSAAQYGLGNQSYINNAIYGAKTGTSNFDVATKNAHGLRYDAVHDLWVTGTSPDYAISVWYGYHDIDRNYTNTVNTIQHRKLFQKVGQGIFKTGSNFTKSAGVIEVRVEKGSDPVKLASDKTPSDQVVTELFKLGTEPTEISTKYIQLDNVTNLKGNLTNNTLTLTWNSVAKQKDCDPAWGQIAYRIYSVKDDKLTLVKTTTSTNVALTVTSKSPNKYVVKTIYESYDGNMSSGAEITVALPKEETITIALKGQYAMSITVNSTFTDPGYSVKEGKTDVTSKAKVTKKIIDAATNKTVEKIDTSKVGTYKITYTIKYEETSKTLTRTVTIAPKSNTTTDKEQEKETEKEENKTT